MARNPASSFDERKLSKGEVRKLNALRKSLGQEIADKAFSEWLEQRPVAGGEAAADDNARRIAEALWPLVERGEIRIPRGGYLLRRGRGRIILEPGKES